MQLPAIADIFVSEPPSTREGARKLRGAVQGYKLGDQPQALAHAVVLSPRAKGRRATAPDCLPRSSPPRLPARAVSRCGPHLRFVRINHDSSSWHWGGRQVLGIGPNSARRSYVGLRGKPPHCLLMPSSFGAADASFAGLLRRSGIVGDIRGCTARAVAIAAFRIAKATGQLTLRCLNFCGVLRTAMSQYRSSHAQKSFV